MDTIPTEEQSETAELKRIERVQTFAARIGQLTTEAVSRRSSLENRWLQDLRQYEGQYDPQAEQALLNDPTKSAVFINLTRARTNAAEARVVDMLFPTDDRNWGVEPTPVPTMADIRQQAQHEGDQDTQSRIDDINERAEKAAELMQDEIDDQLSEAEYQRKARDAVHDMALYGTGVLKAPVIVGRTRKAWKQVQDENGQPASVLEIVEDHMPTVQHVSIWDYFPDPNAVTLDDASYELERHYLTRKALFDLLKTPGFFHEEIERLLEEGSSRIANDNGRMAQLRAISGLTSMDYFHNRYEMWEYHGTCTKDELVDLGVELEDDDFREVDCIVFLCNGRVIKATINPMETGDHPYCVLPWQKDESSVFGKGIPNLMRDSQGVINASWRTMIENMGLSSGDQIVLDRKAIQPADGNWRLSPRKLWYKKDANVPVRDAFNTYPIASHQAEIMAIIDAAAKLGDEETNMPKLMMGEQPGASAQTMGGMAMMMNQANVVLRRAIKNYDDHVTRPLIRRFYDWNMQFSRKEEIKGDYSCKARGSSALLVKEQQAASLMQFAQLVLSSGATDVAKVPDMLRKIAQALHLEADDILLSQEELDANQQKAAQAGADQQPQDPAMIRAQTDMQIAQMKLEAQQQMEQLKSQERQQESQTRMAEAQINREIAMMRMSAERDMSIETINAKLQEVEANNQSKWKLMLAEIAVKSQFGSGI